VECIDAFTNRIVEAEDIFVTVNGCSPVVTKEKKYHIFQNVGLDIVEVNIISLLYEKRSCQLQLNSMASSEKQRDCRVHMAFGIPMLSIVLYPGEGYVLPSGYARRVCEGKPEEEIRVVKNRETVFFLAEDYQGGDGIRFFVPDRQEMEWGYLRIESRQGREYEDFAILERRGGLLYVMDRELQAQYEKGSKLYELYCVRADRDGKAVVITKESEP
jgi:hypothetical protein